MPPKKIKKEKKFKKPNDWRNWVWYALLGLMIASVVATSFTNPKSATVKNFSSFMTAVEQGNVTNVTIRSNENLIEWSDKNEETFKSFFVAYPEFISELRDKGVNINVNPSDSGWVWSVFIQALLPFILIALLWFFIFRQAQGANSQAMSFGKSKANPWKKDENGTNTKFKDVAGINEAVEEVKEIVDFLKQPKKYQAIGAKIPKGVLLMGPPGTGKTLLAKAIAGEADVPFLSISGSDFVEMFVGVGASRVRDLFKQAKKTQPSIIFIDEMDAVGRHRGAGLGGGHDEREQTLNQLLVEMDGFDDKQTVIIIAATNRPDILDPALLRPGRFDRQVVVDKPDVKGREQILEIHSKGKKIVKNINLETIAKRTPGYTGADLANLLNEAALLAARANKKQVSMIELEEATDRIMAGPERKSRVISDKEKQIIAHHEVGHALVAFFCEGADPVHKISILPRGMALGYTLQLPIEDKHLISREEILDRIKILLGGRIAEEMIFNSITSGASNDIEKATSLARNFVCKFGMSTKLGTIKYGKSQNHVFLGKDYSDHSQDYAEETASEIDKEIKRIISDAYNEAKDILTKNKKKLVDISKVLMQEEVLESEAFIRLAKPKKARKVSLD
jgi:cell division protease FtsH